MAPFNVASTESSIEARLLANFAHTPFRAWGARFASFEGFWQGLKHPEGSAARQATFALWGEAAWEAGRRAGTTDAIAWRGLQVAPGSPEHHELARAALRAKVTQVPAVRRALLATGTEEITHIVRRPDGTVLPDSRTLPGRAFARLLMDLREEIRRVPADEPPARPRIAVKVTVNGAVHEGQAEPRRLLTDFLREDLGFKGVRVACEQGVCGACTVLIGGRTARACLTLAAQADGQEITTVEGLASGEQLHPIQQAFWNRHGLQCGYCTPGMLLTSLELLEGTPEPTEAQVRHALAGNVCRCTGYVHIVDAVLAAAEALRRDRSP